MNMCGTEGETERERAGAVAPLVWRRGLPRDS